MNVIRRAILASVVSILCALAPAEALQYKLAYWYEVGGHQNANGCVGCACTGTGNHSVYVHVLNTDGGMVGNIRVEDADFPGFFGVTSNNPNDKFGFCEIPIPPNNSPRLRVNHSGLPTDVTVEMIEQRGPTWGHYSWECAFMQVPDDIDVTFDDGILGTPNISSTEGNAGCILNAPFTRSCAYYDLDPLNWASDAFTLDTSALTYGQTFVATGNRVVLAKFQMTVGFLQTLRYGVRIRENGPGGAILGTPAVSRVMLSDEYYPQMVTWPLFGDSAVVVQPGNTYYAEIYRADQAANINTYRRTNNVYPHGQMYRNGAPVSGSDLQGRIVCATVVDPAPMIQLSTPTLTPEPVQCTLPADQVFTVTNSGQNTMNYTVTTNQSWLRVIPTSGMLGSGESRDHRVEYRVHGMAASQYQAQITLADPNALNSPQQIQVGLNVVKPLVPGDFDGDCDVDQSDFGHFQICYTSPGVEVTDPACRDARLDPDVDVDLADFGVFQLCMSGANKPASPDCAD